MHHRYSLLRDCFGQSYQLVHGFEPPHPAAQRKDFWCPELTKSFLLSLRVPVDYWRHLLGTASLEGSPNYLTDIEVIDTVAERLVQGGFHLYEFPALEKRALRNGKGSAFSFVRGPEPFPTDKEHLPVSNKGEADHYLASLHANPAFWHNLLHENGLLPSGLHPQKSSASEYHEIISGLLASRELLLYKIKGAPATPKSSAGADVLANTADIPGNRMAHLVVPEQPSSTANDARELNLTYPVETEPNTAFFWSGKTGGVGGGVVARQIAKESGGTTLEAIIESREIQMPAWDSTNPDVVKAWKTISADYATGASGVVRAVIGRNLRPGNVWESAELPALMKNPNVDKIIVVDPVTKAEAVVFLRNKNNDT